MALNHGGAPLNMANGVREFAHSIPQQIAVIDGSQTLTYAELGERSSRGRIATWCSSCGTYQ